jgi:type IV secretion system protein TrbI
VSAGRPSRACHARCCSALARPLGIGGALFLALKPQHRTAGSELYDTNNRNTPDGLATLPKDYTGLPRSTPQLGPPLPGDLGRPILNAGAPAPGMPMPTAGSSPEEQRVAQEQEAARLSHLFATTNVAQTGAASSPLPAAAQPTVAATNGGTTDLTSQDHKLAFLNGHVDRRTTSPDRVQPPASPNVLQAGAVIPASLITGLRSDLPGPVTAQVTEDVYDSPTGKTLLIPQGGRLIGQYDAQVSFGQSRALLIWNRLIMPNGRSGIWNHAADRGGRRRQFRRRGLSRGTRPGGAGAHWLFRALAGGQS